MASCDIITAADVARAAGVDRSTVSRILNRSFEQHHYASETIRAVEQAARDLDYQPSTTARALRTGRSMQVGLIVGDIANSFFGRLTAVIETDLRSHGYRLMIGSTSEDAAEQRQHLEDMRQRGVDGIIMSPVGGDGLEQMKAGGKPVVLVDRPLSGTGRPYVGIDNHDAGRQLGAHLHRLGYRRIGVVSPQIEDDPTLRWRLEGLAEGFGPNAAIAWQHTLQFRPGEVDRRVLSQRIRTGEAVEAVVGLTGDCTVTAMESLRDVGWRVPDRVGLAGIDDFRAAALLDPPLTVVAQPVEAIAATAVEYLLALMANQPSPQDCYLSPRLIDRRSLRTLETK